VLGYLEAGIEAWKLAGKELDTVNRITAEQFAAKVNVKEDTIVDVRKETEYSAEHIKEAYNKPLASINEWIKDVNPQEFFYLHCAGGYRSMVAASILMARGYRNFAEVEGGFNAISKTNVPKTNFVCQSKIMNG